jgi:hypothetical protein
MKDRAVRLRAIALARDTLQLAPGLAARISIGADVAPCEPAVTGAIRLWTELLLRVDSASASSGGAPGAVGREARLCSQASHSGLWSSPGKGLGSLERLRRSLSGLRDLCSVVLGVSGHQIWMRRQINTRAINRSW